MDKKGWYDNSKKKLYDCSQLGGLCNGKTFHQIHIDLNYSCSGHGRELTTNQLTFHNVHESKTIDVVSKTSGGASCGSRVVTGINVRVSDDNALINSISTRISELNAATAPGGSTTAQTNSSTTTNTNPVANNTYNPPATSKFEQDMENVSTIVNASAPLIEGLVGAWNKGVDRRNAAILAEREESIEKRYRFNKNVSKTSEIINSWTGFQKYFINQIPQLLENPSATWERLLGSPFYNNVFGEEKKFVTKKLKQYNGGYKFEYSMEDHSKQRKHIQSFLIDEKDIVYGISIVIFPEDPYYKSSIERYLQDVITKIGENYILIAGNIFLLKDKLIIVEYDEITMLDLSVGARTGIVWPEEYLNIQKLSNGQYKYQSTGIGFNRGIDTKKEENPSNSDILLNKMFFKTSSSGNGVLVATVKPGSAAEKAGLKAGDIITKVKEMNVTSPYIFQLIEQGYADKGDLSFTYLRDGIEYKTPLSMPNPGYSEKTITSLTEDQKFVFNDDFSDNQNNWFEEETDKFSFKITDGKYRIQSKKGGSWLSSLPIQFSTSMDFEISARIRKISGTDGYYFGMILGKDGRTGYHHFAGVTGLGNYVFADKGPTPEDVIPNTENTVVLKGNTTNYIVIKKEKGFIKLLINERLMGQTVFGKFYGDLFGFQVWSGDESLIIEVDKLTIKTGDDQKNP
jgi:hypothetical protein